MMRPGRKSRLRRPCAAGGFTLLEILVSLAIVGLLLIGISTFVFSMGELWGRRNDVRLFDQHVAAVSRFLEQTLEAATLPPAARANSTPVAPLQVTPPNGGQENLISFDLPQGSRILVWPGRPLPEVACSLEIRATAFGTQSPGLYLLWHSRLETNFDTQPPRETLITPFVTEMRYDYYDDNLKRWTEETILRTDSNGQPLAPQRLELHFVYGKLGKWVPLPVPSTLAGLPNF
jgi:prepilin-type N-terminal cleavage/methylation domain-containing protein